MTKLKIGVSGEVGSFSEQAARYYADKNNVGEFDIEYLVSAEKVLASLDSGVVDLGIFPIENSNGGIVYEAVYAMAAHLFVIENMFEIDVQHCLMALPDKNPGDIEVIVSHQQALKQCRMYLKRKWGETELREYADTAIAAKDLSQGKLEDNCAVIAPKICAELYNLSILEEGIQDLKFNFTTFICAKKK